MYNMRSPNSNKICQTASKICANGPRKHDNSDPIPRERNIYSSYFISRQGLIRGIIKTKFSLPFYIIYIKLKNNVISFYITSSLLLIKTLYKI